MGETIRIRAYDSGVGEIKLASVWIDVNQYLFKQTVAVVPSLTDEACWVQMSVVTSLIPCGS